MSHSLGGWRGRGSQCRDDTWCHTLWGGGGASGPRAASGVVDTWCHPPWGPRVSRVPELVQAELSLGSLISLVSHLRLAYAAFPGPTGLPCPCPVAGVHGEARAERAVSLFPLTSRCGLVLPLVPVARGAVVDKNFYGTYMCPECGTRLRGHARLCYGCPAFGRPLRLTAACWECATCGLGLNTGTHCAGLSRGRVLWLLRLGGSIHNQERGTIMWGQYPRRTWRSISVEWPRLYMPRSRTTSCVWHEG